MDIIIVCHTEFGFVSGKYIIFEKKATFGVTEGVLNLIKIADRYGAKVSFAACPEVVPHLPKNINHEIGLHIHPGWQESNVKVFKIFIGDKYLKENCKQSLNSVALRDFSFEEQFGMIKTGKEYVKEKLDREPTFFVAGKLSENNDTIKALIEAKITHDCSAASHCKDENFDWTGLPRISMPYNPSTGDYQKEGDLPILIVPISQFFPRQSVNLELISQVGQSWLNASFLEYYNQDAPLFHIILHSPSMTNEYFILAMDNFLTFVSKYKNINFRFVSEIKKYPDKKFKTNIFPYLRNLNMEIIATGLKKCV